ncbi:MAG: hypothetical protein MUF73_06700 [Rhodobacteraceae bacterium]|jgi:hypothetical protein|nr:hypothetical protein [Paracoccaceae bacterium]
MTPGRRLTRRFPAENGLEKGGALSFLFEHLDSVTNAGVLPHRLRLFKAEIGK